MGYFGESCSDVWNLGLRSGTRGTRFVLKSKSVAEVADAGEDHGDAEVVGGGDDLRVIDGATGLDYGCRTGCDCSF